MPVDIAIIVLLLLAVAQFRTPPGARRGNITAAAALAAALAAVLLRNRISSVPSASIAAAVGVLVGAWVAMRVTMIQIPAMVALQHGAGGVAALLVSFVELGRMARAPMAPANEIAALLGLIVGAGTFSGSMIASGKLAAYLPQTPRTLPGHNGWFATALACAAGLAVWAGSTYDAGHRTIALAALAAVSMAVGVLIAVRVGGADMPVLISFLNATAGLAAALCGVAIQNRLLIACGATVAASGSVLTHVMCRGMNRGLGSVFTGVQTASIPAQAQAVSAASAPESSGQPEAMPDAPSPADPMGCAAALLQAAKRIIIIPGYGMALAEAQEDVVQLAEHLASLGKDVKFAVHPVAGRMPGHMHVVLAEAELDYGKLFEMKDVNDQFAETDVALVVGACDVVNTAAIHSPNTPISGMPILKAHEARHIIVCNLDERPGYSGVENPLYRDGKTIMLLGDAKATVATLRRRLP